MSRAPTNLGFIYEGEFEYVTTGDVESVHYIQFRMHCVGYAGAPGYFNPMTGEGEAPEGPEVEVMRTEVQDSEGKWSPIMDSPLAVALETWAEAAGQSTLLEEFFEQYADTRAARRSRRY